MKKLIYIFLILLGFTSCMKDDKATMEPDATDKVDIIFGVDLPETMTKVMADDPQVNNLRVAVFGGSGFLKEYVQADPIGYATENSTKYNYKVRLSLSDSYLKVHFIANGPATLPFKYEDEVMSVQTVSGNQDAYWQKIELPDGIKAKKDADGIYIKVNGEYVVSDETKAKFQDIPLVRNFAKIVVESTTSDFTLKSYALVNKPTAGSIAPYNKKTNAFVMNYQDSTMTQLKSWYPGNIPAAVTLDKSIPEASAFSANPVYMYERPIPTEDATFLIVFGTYGGKDYYYRIELQDANGYYAIYRNWVYTINITGILRPGAATPTDAANSSGSGDVSTDQKAENLTDVSDGVARIFVQYTDTTIVGNGVNVTLKYMFLPDADATTSSANGEVSGGVGVEIAKHEVGATGAVIAGDITRAGSDDEQHWRTLSFTTTNAGEVTKTESIKITGHYMNGSVPSKLFRIVTFHLMSLQEMQVICNPHEILKGKGEKVDVLIKIPKDLPRSLFPLQLKIESSKNSISPDNDNLPVTAGKSIIDGITGTYQFVKTLDYDAYLALQEASSDDWVTVTTHFKTTKESSDCDVYVANQYFNTAHDSFSTYTMKNFTNLHFSNTTQTNPDMPVLFSFNMVAADIPERVIIKLNGLKPAEGSGLINIGTNTYEYLPITNEANIPLLTSGDEGVYGAEISASHYYTASIGNLSYTNTGFTSSAAAGRNKPIDFEFSYVNGIVESVTFTLTNLKPQTDDDRFTNLGGGKWKFEPGNTDEDQTITFLTESWDNVSLTMSGASYNPTAAITSTAATTMTIEANSLHFYRNNNAVTNYAVRMYNNSSTYQTVTSQTGYNNYNSYNSQFTITRSSLNSNLTVYFRRGDRNGYSGAISVYDLDDASTGNVLRVDLNNGSAPTL